MLDVDRDQNIKLTRGDTAYIDIVELRNRDGAIYELVEGDRVFFRLKAGTIIAKELDIDLLNSRASLHILPTDTIGLSYTSYKYEMELVTSTGEHYTFIADRNFTITEEVEEHNGN